MEKEERRSGIHAITYDVAKEPDDYVKEEEKKRSVAEDVVVMRVDSEKQGIATEEKRSRIVAVEEKRNEVERQMMATEEESMRCFNAEEAQSEAYETQMMAKEEENSRYVTAEEAQREAYEAQMMAKEEENSRCVAVEEVQREDNEAQMMAKEEERMRVLLAEEEKLLDACLEHMIFPAAYYPKEPLHNKQKNIRSVLSKEKCDNDETSHGVASIINILQGTNSPVHFGPLQTT